MLLELILSGANISVEGYRRGYGAGWSSGAGYYYADGEGRGDGTGSGWDGGGSGRGGGKGKGNGALSDYIDLAAFDEFEAVVVLVRKE